MNIKKQYAFNKLFNICMFLGLFFLLASILFFMENDISFGISLGIISVFIIVFSSLFTPCYYAFDIEGVSLCYVFLPNERYLWKDIHAIEVEFNSVRSNFLSLIYASVFHIKGVNVGKTRFYMHGNIRKSFRTKYLFEKYWDGTITGYLFEDVKKWFAKRKTKKQKQIEAHLTNEIVQLEREVRAEVREWIKPFIIKAKQQNIEIKTKYLYITKDFEELKSRPKNGYTYTLIAEISTANEIDENRIFVVSVDLLYVRLGKTSYHGVNNKNAKDELSFGISDALKEIINIQI